MHKRFRAENLMRRGLTYLAWLLAKLFLSLGYLGRGILLALNHPPTTRLRLL